jgi:hypothetical protein
LRSGKRESGYPSQQRTKFNGHLRPPYCDVTKSD